MTVEETVQAMYDHYPTLFKTRADCYNHLFCTIGTEYAWIDGELVDIDENIKPINKLNHGMAKQYNKLSLRQDAIWMIENCGISDVVKQKFKSEEDEAIYRKEYMEKAQALPDDKFYEYPRKYRWDFYFIKSKLAKLFRVPDDIRGDWQAAIEECKLMLEQDGYNVSDPQKLAEDLREQKETFKKKMLEKESKKGWYID